LRTHVALGNRIGAMAVEGRRATAVFHGPHAYVSARWYEHPSEQVPTWNYAVVHVHGTLTGPMDGSGLLRLLDDLAARHEAGASSPWSRTRTSPELIDSLVKGIIGFTLPIDRIEGKFKLSQNRSGVDQSRVREALRQRGGEDDLEMVELMLSPSS
jgi:transcriptional regulator